MSVSNGMAADSTQYPYNNRLHAVRPHPILLPERAASNGTVHQYPAQKASHYGHLRKSADLENPLI